MKKHALLAAIAATFALPGAAIAANGLSFSDSVRLDSNGGANKTKIVRMANGRLVSVYGDYLDPDSYTIYDVKAQGERPARDLFVRTCAADCDQAENWTAKVNISNTASKHSIETDWDGYTNTLDADGEIVSTTREAKPFPGDSDKPNIFNAGSRVVVTWVDKFCEGEEGQPTAQRMVSYRSLENREVPFSCAYAATSVDNGVTWSEPQQLSTGERDAKQDVSRGLGTGQWAFTWQEDPRGLQRGEAEGPGDGASGSNTSHGSDIWISHALENWTTQEKGIWTTPVRVTDNYDDTQTASGNFDVVRDAAGNDVSDSVEGGRAGASRANLALQLGSLDSVPQVILAYEETKGSDGLDEGKYVRYHTFDWNNQDLDEAGCIISNPALNARRVRFVPQKEPGAASGMRLGIFWKEGEFTQGGPSDIMLRKGIVNANGVTGGNGFSPAEMVPAVDANCAVSDLATAIALNNEPALNMSSRAEDAQITADADIANSTLSDDTNLKVEESANAHRGLLRGDDLYIGYTYTPVLAELLYTNTQNYNFYLRHYDGVNQTWSAPENLSNETDTTVNVREPRLVGTPGSTDKCSTDPEECQDKGVFYLAWGKQTNVSAWSNDETSELDLYAARVENNGDYVTPVVTFAGEAEGVEDYESQIRMTPAGNRLFAVWNEVQGDNTVAMYRESTVVDLPDEVVETDEGDGTLVGCSYSPGAPFDPTLLLLTALAIGGLTVRSLKARS
ncbi:choice-of-anchor O protein [Marinobacter sp. 2_MG-2023]|uniref:choice-of-anchor O protein n=1 Tax=Marinobacter sp. 2_MG-2023 TaxID=3062679 RepID=UPI0026E46D71|nr:choice-of-anchor O protein [Marinobacter sp. 2_MG-2023]MDO6441658.1 choice-of-anchor O protein [Marinobacter sp. 2_MG-2023]